MKVAVLTHMLQAQASKLNKIKLFCAVLSELKPFLKLVEKKASFQVHFSLSTSFKAQMPLFFQD